MIELLDWSFENIRSFVDKQSISIEGRDKLIQFDGENRNTGGSSGSGKSTALIAIDYLFGFSDIPSTILQSWITKDSIMVEGNFNINKLPTYMSRSKKKGFHLKYGSEEFQGKLAEEKLQEIINIPKDVFKQMIHKKQDQRGFFLNKTAKQMYEFLVDMLGLSFYEKKQEKISKDIKTQALLMEESARKMENIEASMVDLGSVLSEKTAPDPITDGELHDLEANLKFKLERSEQLNKMEAQKHEALKAVKAAEYPERVPFNDSDLSGLKLKLRDTTALFNQRQSARTDINIKVMGFDSMRSLMKSKAQSCVDVSKQLQDLRNNQCFTCKQHYSGEDAKTTEARLLSIMDKEKSEILAIKDTLGSEESLNKELDRLSKEANLLSSQIDELQGMMAVEKKAMADHDNKYEEQVSHLKTANRSKELEISNKWNSVMGVMRTEISLSNEQITRLQSKKDSYDRAKNTYETECNGLKSKITEYKKQHTEQVNKLETAETTLKVAEEAHRLIKTYTIQVFQDTLNNIGDIATDMISNIPNIQNSAIYFEGCKENKNGSIKDEVTPVISINGHNKVPVKAFSGGQKTAIELAVDLAVIDVIESKAGKGANFFILDEPFNGLDSVCKEACLEVLRQYDTNKKIIMIDHSSELKEMVSDVITVVMEGETSFVA